MMNENDLDAVTRNCEKAQNRIAKAYEIARYHVYELAYLLSDAALDREKTLGEEFFAAYKEVRRRLYSAEGSQTAPHSELAGALASFCSAVCDICAERGRPLSPVELAETESEPENSKIAYMRNSVSDEAYRIFSTAVKNASVVYPESFAAVCEEVYYGRTGYCILPYETSEEGTLSGFTRLIRKYELCPNMVCSVPTEQGVTRFVLLGRGQYASAYSVRCKRRYLRTTVFAAEQAAFSRLCGVAGELKAVIRKTESIPVAWNDGRYAITVTFELPDSAISPFLLYLALEMPECDGTAVYAEI